MRTIEMAVLAAVFAAWMIPAQAENPLAISEHKLYQYWRPHDGPAPVTQARIKGVCERSAVQVSYIVGSDGFTHDVEIVRSIPLNPFYEQYVRSTVSQARFTPAPANQTRQPVQLTETYRFECPPRI